MLGPAAKRRKLDVGSQSLAATTLLQLQVRFGGLLPFKDESSHDLSALTHYTMQVDGLLSEAHDIQQEAEVVMKKLRKLTKVLRTVQVKEVSSRHLILCVWRAS